MCVHTTKTQTLLLAFAWDTLLGEPPNQLHPVVWLGHLIATLERHAPREQPVAELAYGGLLTAIGVGAAALPAWLLERHVCAKNGHTLLTLSVSAYALKSAFAWRSLMAAGKRVQTALAAGDIAAARAELGWLVSRDTSALDESLIAAAAIESLAENASDSVVAPLLCYALFGLPGVWAYRAANTLDAMVGYRGRYEYLGKLPARLDDLLNIVPARLTALLCVAVAGVSGGSARAALGTWRNDSGRTASPNAGQPMSAVAGALGVRLEKREHYLLNAAGRPPHAADIMRASQLLNAALVVAAALVVGVVAMHEHAKEIER